MKTLRIAVSLSTLFATLVLISGCVQPVEIKNVKVAMHLENVRRVEGDSAADEWRGLRDAIESVAAKDTFHATERDETSLAGTSIRVRNIDTQFTVNRLRDLELIHGKIIALRDRKQKGPIDRIDFELMDRSADLRYRSNYITATIEIRISGVTTPRAEVFLELPGGMEHFVAKADGKWSYIIKMRREQQWVYGYSVDAESGVRKSFRLDVFAQKQELLTEDEYKVLRQKEK